MTPRVTPEQAADIIRRYQAGETAPHIAATLNLSRDTIKRHLHAAGIPLRDDRGGRGPINLARRVAALGTTSRALRAWARAQGMHVPRNGQVPHAILDAYQTAQDNPTGETP